MVKHTPGPWEARGKMVSSGKDCVGGESICQCYDNGIANARLIAVAPELFEALKKLSEIVNILPRQASNIDGKLTSALGDALRIIAKAEGK